MGRPFAGPQSNKRFGVGTPSRVGSSWVGLHKADVGGSWVGLQKAEVWLGLSRTGLLLETLWPCAVLRNCQLP
jgi:hypothetical protein